MLLKSFLIKCFLSKMYIPCLFYVFLTLIRQNIISDFLIYSHESVKIVHFIFLFLYSLTTFIIFYWTLLILIWIKKEVALATPIWRFLISNYINLYICTNFLSSPLLLFLILNILNPLFWYKAINLSLFSDSKNSTTPPQAFWISIILLSKK